MTKRACIPYALILFRFFLVFIMPFIAYKYGEKYAGLLTLLLFLGVLSDIFDGIIARRLGVATDHLRRMDSQTNMLFWLSVLFSTYIIHPALILSIIPMIAVLVALEIACYVTSFLRFGREPCTHSYLAKCWGLTLFLACANMLARGETGVLWTICFAIGLAAQIEVIAILLTLPTWNRDVKSFYHVWKMSKSA